MSRSKLSLIALVSYVAALTTWAVAQAQTPQAPWSGWARCEITVTGQGYNDQQTHTWMISGSSSVVTGAFRVYPATWSVVGSGSVQHTQDNQTSMAQWTTNAQNLSAPLAVFVRASDKRMFIQARHTQTRAPHSVNGYQQLTIDGKPQKPTTIAAEAFEWSFPVVAVSRPKPGALLVANGSSTPVVNGKVGYMQPAGTQASASCTWQFGQGDATPASPPAVTAPPTPAASALGNEPECIRKQRGSCPSASGISASPLSSHYLRDLGRDYARD